jgi:protein-tyrosine-phosphatase
MAEAVANHYANILQCSAERPAMRFCSAGLYAHVGDPISQNAVRALELAGIEPSAERDFHSHRAHTLTEEEAECYDLLVGMSDGHAMELLLRFPALASRITVLSPSVSDPYGGDLARYEATLRDILTGVRAAFFPQAEEET